MLAAMKKKRNWNRFSLASKKMWDKEGGDARMPQVFLLDQFADGLNYAKLLDSGTLDNPVYTEVYTGRKKHQRNGVIAHRKCLLRKSFSYTSDSFAWLVGLCRAMDSYQYLANVNFLGC